MRTRIAFAALLVGTLALASSVSAGPRGQWTQLRGTVINFAEPGLARTSDGVLHIVYVRRAGTKPELVHVAVEPSGIVGAASVALGGSDTLAHPDLLRMPDDTLRAFFGGIRARTSGLFTATAPASGRPWTLQPGLAAQSQYAYATSVTGAGLANGTPISTWSGTPGLRFHYGVDPADPDHEIPQSGCCLDNPDIGVEGVSGQAWVGFFSLEDASPGLFVNKIGPSGRQGGRKLAPGSVTGGNALRPGNRTPITGRIGAPGVFLVYGQGYPTFKTLALWRVDRPRPHLVLKADRNEHANVAVGPEGRLWLVWKQGAMIRATRTNKAATRIGPVSTLKPPRGGAIFRLNGEGSAGPLDLIVNVQAGASQGLWHQQVLPKLTLSASERRSGPSRTITFRVLDAGDPVAGASVKAAGRTLKTNAKGIATHRDAPAGRIRATASKAGYAPATVNLR